MSTQATRSCFISYSHPDRSYANQLAQALNDKGLRVWIDSLEILPGDSLIQKIFEEGLKDCDVFLVLLSQNSVNSEWVKHEIDAALLNRLKKITRVVPILVEECPVPVALRPLRWLRLSDGLDHVADLVAQAAFGQKPSRTPTGSPPLFVQKAPEQRGGLSTEAAVLAAFLASQLSTSDYPNPMFEGKQLAEGTGLPPELLNDAVDELEANGMLKTLKAVGTNPFEFYAVEPTYLVAYLYPEDVKGDLDPDHDVRQLAAMVASLGRAQGPELSEKLGFEPNRVNFAAEYLEDYGLVQVHKWTPSLPYSFGELVAIRETRQYVSD